MTVLRALVMTWTAFAILAMFVNINAKSGWWHFLLLSSQIIPFPVAGARREEEGGGKQLLSDVICDSFAH